MHCHVIHDVREKVNANKLLIVRQTITLSNCIIIKSTVYIHNNNNHNDNLLSYSENLDIIYTYICCSHIFLGLWLVFLINFGVLNLN